MATKKAEQKLVEQLIKNKDLHFERTEVQALLDIFTELTKGLRGCIDRAKFREVLHQHFSMTDDMILDRVYHVFDLDSDGTITVDEWVRSLSIFLRGDLQEQIAFCFHVYDLNSNGYVTREEMFHMLKTSLVKQGSLDEDPDEGVKDLVDLILKKMDTDHDTRVTFAEYKTAVSEMPLLMEAFGPCLPTQKSKASFELAIANRVNQRRL